MYLWHLFVMGVLWDLLYVHNEITHQAYTQKILYCTYSTANTE